MANKPVPGEQYVFITADEYEYLKAYLSENQVDPTVDLMQDFKRGMDGLYYAPYSAISELESMLMADLGLFPEAGDYIYSTWYTGNL